MSFLNWTQSMIDRFKQSGYNGGDSMEANMANGGHGGYRPPRNGRVSQATQSFTQMGMEPQQTMQQEMPLQPEMPQDPYMPAGSTGFTGMYPPVGGYQQTGAMPQGMNATAYQQPVYPMNQQQTAYQAPVSQQTAYQQWNQPAWQPQQPMQQQWTSQQAQVQQTNWNELPTVGNTQRQVRVGGYPYQDAAPARGRHAQASRFQPQEPAPQPQPNNISYMPGSFVGDDGKAYSHVERVTQLLSVSACYRLIEFMRNGESVIVNTEQIASEGEIQRCLDMLSGAAFTLGCTITKITSRRCYLIAPAAVLVMPDTVIQKMSERDGNQWTPEAGEETRRERRIFEERGPRTAAPRRSEEFGYDEYRQDYGTYGR